MPDEIPNFTLVKNGDEITLTSHLTKQRIIVTKDELKLAREMPSDQLASEYDPDVVYMIKKGYDGLNAKPSVNQLNTGKKRPYLDIL